MDRHLPVSTDGLLPISTDRRLPVDPWRLAGVDPWRLRGVNRTYRNVIQYMVRGITCACAFLVHNMTHDSGSDVVGAGDVHLVW